MEYNSILRAVTVRITTRDEERGSAIIYRPVGSDLLYIFTAKHCVFGRDLDNNVKRKHIKIDKIKVAGRKTIYTLRKEDRIIIDDEADIAALVINSGKFPGFDDIPHIQLAALDKDHSDVWFKGYPFLTGGEAQKSGKATLHTLDTEDEKFRVAPEADFLRYYNKSKILGLCKGFSGSGICGCVGETAYLQGVISRFDKSIGFECVSLQNFLATKLPELKLAHIFIERYLPDSMLRANLEQVLDRLKPRYQALNFKLPIEDYIRQLDADLPYREMVTNRVGSFLERADEFTAAQTKYARQFLDSYGAATIDSGSHEGKTFRTVYGELLEIVQGLSHLFDYLIDDFENLENWRLLIEQVHDLSVFLSELIHALRNHANAIAHEEISRRRLTVKFVRQFNDNNLNLLSHVENLIVFLRDQKFIGKKYILVKGEAGNGKSQLLGFMANERMAMHCPTILVLGQSLNQGESIWAQISGYCSKQFVPELSFLEILNLKGKLSGRPVVVFIDAINEGSGIRLWNYGFNQFIAAIEPFHHIKVVLSYRNSYEKALFRNLVVDRSAIIEHHGFQGVEREAVKFFFQEANLPVPILPFYSLQFGNPLFLRLFTLLYKNHSGSVQLNSWAGTLAIYNHFFAHINDQLGADYRFEYEADKLDLVGLAIKKFVKKQLKRRSQYLKYQTAFKVVERAVGFFTKQKGFFAELVSQGLFYENRYLTGDNEDELGVDFAYQKLGEYIKAQFLIRKLTWHEAQRAMTSAGRLFFLADDAESTDDYAGLIEASTIVLQFYFGKEVFDLSPKLIEREDVVRAFISALRDRSSSTITAQTLEYVNRILSRDWNSVNNFWTNVLNYSFQPANALNTDFIHNYLLSLTLPERDATWTLFVNNTFEDLESHPAVLTVINWAMSYRVNGIVEENEITAIGKTLFWFLSTTDVRLRDFSTKAAIFLFTENIPSLIRAMADFENVNDPYISQRIYAVAFGVAVRVNQASAIADLVDYIYRQVFLQSYVTADILLRDYARLAIEYGIYLGLESPSKETIRPPYRSQNLGDLPTDIEIDAYPLEFGYSDGEYAGIHAILTSMITEHSSRQLMYGDFGRYTFGYAVKHWKDLSDSLLSNRAIQIIVRDLGYNRRLSDLDNRFEFTGRSRPKIERFGKKYQWIALHRILAQLADNYKYYDSSRLYTDNAVKDEFSGAWEPKVRDIDPTTMIIRDRRKPENAWWRRYTYQLPEQPIADWLKDGTNLPDPQKLLQVKDDEGEIWLTLEAHKEWREGARQLWYQLRSYIIKEVDQKRITNWLREQNLMGRWMPESQSNIDLYLREYYWSPSVGDLADAYHGGLIWQDLYGRKGGKKIGEVSVSALQYYWETGADFAQMEATNLLLPNQLLFDLLKLNHGTVDGHFENQNGKLVAFDPAAVYDTPSCLLVRKRELFEALKQAKLTILWTGLGEKLNTSTYDKSQPELYRRMEISNVVSLGGAEFTTSTLTAIPKK